MNIELAQELKKAGYPQEVNSFYWKAGPSGNRSVIYGMPTDQGVEFYASPMLSELIEACGNAFESLRMRDHQWLAMANIELLDKSQGRLGKTPEEAVARLWLTLNSKNEQHNHHPTRRHS